MKNKFLLFIVLFGFLIRVVGLSNHPAGFTWDEAALGYNAYSLLLTGKDEHSQKFPLILKSFGDYKPGIYIYYSVLPIKLFGLSEFSTRLSSTIFGSISIFLIFLLSYKLFNKKIAYISAILLAINPMMIHFSRGAWEANLNLFLLLLIANLFIISKYFIVALFSVISLYTYQGAKLNTPFLLFILYFWTKPKIKAILLPTICLIICTLPLIIGLSTQSGRLKVFSVFSYTRSQDYVRNLISQDPKSLQYMFSLLFHSEIYDQFRGISQRFLNHLSPSYLFKEGNWTDLRQSVTYYGNFHLFESLTIAIGFVYLTKKNIRLLGTFCCLIVGFILPSALSRDIITTVRSLPLIIPLTIISAIGFTQITKNKLFLFSSIFIMFFSFVYFIDLYFRHYPNFSANAWLFSYKSAISILVKNQNNYSRVYFTDKLGQPYIFLLFYQQYPPKKYQQEVNFQSGINGDVGTVNQFSKYQFGSIYWPSLRTQKHILVVGDEFELPTKDLYDPNIINYGDIKYPNGQIGLRLIGT